MNNKSTVRTDARTKSVRELLSGKKYSIDYYQREYKWGTRHVRELLEDLQNHFLQSYQPSHQREAVEGYAHYFLGSIIVASRNGQSFIIDGQQRLTTLTLVLIHLNNLQKQSESKVEISTLIYSEKFGTRSFNIDIADRTQILEALHNDETFETEDQSDSVQNIGARYDDIIEFYSDNMSEESLPFFIDWLTECVDFVEITAFSDEEAYTIFETMNDRGLSLTPTDMLKGYLLSNLSGDAIRQHLNELWINQLRKLRDAGIEDESDFFKSWLRGQYAQTIRGSRPGEANKDWEKIVSAFHKWVRDEKKVLGLLEPPDFRDFIEREFHFFIRQYARLRQAADSFDFAKKQGLEYVHYNANNGYTLQYPLILSTLSPDDSQEVTDKKIRAVAGFLDIFIIRRFVNFKTTSSNATKGRVFNWIMAIRRKTLPEIIDYLYSILDEMDEQGETFHGMQEFYLHQQNKKRVHHILARFTYELETGTGIETSFDKYSSTKAKTRFEIEHIWSNNFERHKDEFDSEMQFLPYRNRMGGLILLPRGTNQSHGNQPYEVKIRHYIKENLLAQSLHKDAYVRNPNFTKLISSYGLSFQPHEQFKIADLDARQMLYQELCEVIWSAKRLDDELQF